MPVPGEQVGHYRIEAPLGRGGEAAVFESRDAADGRRVVLVAISLADVIAYCHANHVYHRDLKPENIVVGDDGRVMIIDFGIALLKRAPRVTWRGFSGLIGTPEYMAPEQIRGERGGPETDVYAAGVILYEMLANRPPFRSTNPLATMYQHLNLRAEPLDRLRPDVSPPVAAIVARAMRRRPRERFPDGSALLEALRAPERVDIGVLEQPDPPFASPLREGLMRHPFVILGLVGLGTAILVLLAEAVLRH